MSRRDFLKGLLAAGTWGALSPAFPVPRVPACWRRFGHRPCCSGRWKPTEPPNQPMGLARGIFPGRVSWVHDPKSAQWDGNPQSGGWFEDKFNDPASAETMLRQSLRLLCGARTDAEASGALVRHYNGTHGRGETGYRRRAGGRENQYELLQPPRRFDSRAVQHAAGDQALMQQLVQQARPRIRPGRL